MNSSFSSIIFFVSVAVTTSLCRVCSRHGHNFFDALKGLVHDDAHVSVVTVADFF